MNLIKPYLREHSKKHLIFLISDEDLLFMVSGPWLEPDTKGALA
jgi:hypothetical protein